MCSAASLNTDFKPCARCQRAPNTINLCQVCATEWGLAVCATSVCVQSSFNVCVRKSLMCEFTLQVLVFMVDVTAIVLMAVTHALPLLCVMRNNSLEGVRGVSSQAACYEICHHRGSPSHPRCSASSLIIVMCVTSHPHRISHPQHNRQCSDWGRHCSRGAVQLVPITLTVIIGSPSHGQDDPAELLSLLAVPPRMRWASPSSRIPSSPH